MRDEYSASICEGCRGHGYVSVGSANEECSECKGEGMSYKRGGRIIGVFLT